MNQNPTLQTHTEQRDDLVQQCGALNRRKAELTTTVSELNQEIEQRKLELVELGAQKKRIVENEIAEIIDLVKRVKKGTKELI